MFECVIVGYLEILCSDRAGSNLLSIVITCFINQTRLHSLTSPGQRTRVTTSVPARTDDVQSGGYQFGTLKRLWDFTCELMRGRDQILGEIVLLFSIFNLWSTVSILGFSALLKRLKDAFLIIFDNILLTRLRSVSTRADRLDGTPHSTFIFDLPSAATVQHGTKDKLDSELMHRLPLGAII